jgi:hypothetical protein
MACRKIGKENFFLPFPFIYPGPGGHGYLGGSGLNMEAMGRDRQRKGYSSGILSA